MIEELIQNSILLNDSQKADILQSVKNGTPEYRQYVLETLKTEPEYITKIFEKYVQKVGKDGMSYVRGSIQSFKMKLIREEESLDIS